MNQDVFKGNWEQIKGKIRQQWGRLTNDEIEQIKGDRQILLGKLQEHYGQTREEVEADVDRWLDEEFATRPPRSR